MGSHDIFTLGQFKDDRLQSHEHKLTNVGINDNGFATKGIVNYSGSGDITTSGIYLARSGATTRTKEKGVNYLIKVL